MTSRRAQVVAVGAFLPEDRLTNADLEKRVDTQDAWIVSRTGIRERRLAAPGTPASALALPAARQCLERAGVAAGCLDGVIVATITPDFMMPTTANLLQHQLGANQAWAFDQANACNGFVMGLSTGTCFIESGRANRVLVIGVDVMSSRVDQQDRNTCILFGDGAGAVLLEAGPADGPGVEGFELHSDGANGELLWIPCSGSALPATPEALAARKQYLRQDGPKVFSHAIRRMVEVSSSLLARLGRSAAEIDLLVPHQANLRILEPTAERLGVPPDRMVVNLDRCGNTTSATIPLALADAYEAGRLRDGSRVMLTAFGGGFSWGAVFLRWGRG